MIAQRLAHMHNWVMDAPVLRTGPFHARSPRELPCDLEDPTPAAGVHRHRYRPQAIAEAWAQAEV